MAKSSFFSGKSTSWGYFTLGFSPGSGFGLPCLELDSNQSLERPLVFEPWPQGALESLQRSGKIM